MNTLINIFISWQLLVLPVVAVNKCGREVKIIAQCIAIKHSAFSSMQKIKKGTAKNCDQQNNIGKQPGHVLQYKKNAGRLYCIFSCKDHRFAISNEDGVFMLCHIASFIANKGPAIG